MSNMRKNINNRQYNRYHNRNNVKTNHISGMRRHRKSKQLMIFLSTLAVTMIVGLVGIFFMIPDEEHEISVIDFLIKEKEIITETFVGEEPTALSDEPEGWQVETTGAEEVTLLFAGDVLLDDSYAVMSTFWSNGGNIQNAFSENLIQEMQNADVFMLNNEFPFTDRGEPTPNKAFTFRAKPQNVFVLQDMGVDIVSLANNHAYDFGEVSILDTLDTLDTAGIYRVGAGRNIDEASQTVYAQVGPYKVAFLSATQIERNPTPDTKGATADSPGVFRCNSPELMLQRIQEAKENSDFVVLYIHWGTESTTVLDELQRKQSKLYAEAGVDIIIGDHAHCLQEVAYVDDVPTIFSMANFWFNSKTQDTCLVKVYLSEQGMRWQFIPCRQSGCKTVMLDGQDKAEVLSYMRSISSGVIIDEDGFITKKE